jgi:Flp pilus assembly protein TadG
MNQKPSAIPHFEDRSGQILPLFALMLIVIIGLCGLAIDLAHVRSTAEDAQQAADAGALSGVAFLPNQPDLAAQQAIALTAQNGFICNTTPTTSTTVLGAYNEQYVYNCNSTTTITINEYPPGDKLQEIITTKINTSFLKVLGFKTITVTRSSTAQYQDPITMGAPDNQLGNANYPTHAFDYCPPNMTGCTNVHPTNFPQDFYLQLKGSYAGPEHGDAFSPYFMDYSDGGSGTTDVLLNTAGGHYKITDPCGNPCKDSNNQTVVTNPYYNQENAKTGLTGYSYLFTIPGAPAGGPVKTLLKVMDPLDECSYDGTQPGGTTLPNGDLYANDAGVNSYTGSTGYYIYPKVTDPNGNKVSNTFLDQCGNGGSNFVSNSDPRGSQYTNSAYYPTSLSFTVYNPVYDLTSNFTVAGTGTTSTSSYTLQLASPSTTIAGTTGHPSSTTLGASYGVQPLYMGPEFTNDGCTHVNSSSVPLCTGAHGFKWFTLGAVTNNSTSTAYVMLVINSVVSQPETPYYSGTYGTGGNVFSLGICGDDSTDTHIGNPADSGAWIAASLSSYASGALTAQASSPGHTTNLEPARAAQVDVGNTGDGCLSPGTGYMVNARQAMCVMTEQTGADSYIPLANIPTVFTGNNVILKLFDPGDVTLAGTATNNLGVMAPKDNGSTSTTASSPVSLTTSEPYQLDIAAPSGSAYSQCTNMRPPWWGPGPCGTGGSTNYNATDFQNGSGPTFPANGATTTSLLTVATSSGHSLANGTFMDFHIAVPSDYPTQTNTYGNTWWKMYYQLSGGGVAGDTTTWEIVSNAEPIHLIGR